jgi:hypothetical protein
MDNLTEYVILQCIKEKNKLRMKILTNSYYTNANCQCPKNIRIANMKYYVKKSNIVLTKHNNSGKYFYRINGTIIPFETNNDNTIIPTTIFNDETELICIVCFENPKNIIYNPCGHYNMCNECYSKLRKKCCPTCRKDIISILLPEQIR